MDGVTETFALVDVRSISFDENDMNLTLVTGDTIAWNISFVSYYHYEEVVPSSVKETESVVTEFLAYPNPFSESVNFSVSLSQITDLELSVFNLTGQQMAVVASGSQSSGSHKYVWNPGAFGWLPNGTYLAKLSIGNQLYHKLLIKTN